MNNVRPIEKFRTRLDGFQDHGHGKYRALCPAHDDNRPSLDLKESEDGTVLLICRSAGCSVEAIVGAIGLGLNDLFVESDSRRRTPSQRKPMMTTEAYASLEALEASIKHRTETFHYPPHNGQQWVTIRIEPPGQSKRFNVAHQRADGQWVKKKPPGPGLLSLYGSDKLKANDEVFVVEGEGKVDLLRSIGINAVSAAFGAGKAERFDWSPLSNKAVVILPDNDDPGKLHAEMVAEIVSAIPPKSVRIAHLSNLEPGGDIKDWIENHDCRDNDDLCRMLLAIVEAAPAFEPIKPATDENCLRWRPFPVELIPKPVSTYITEAALALGCDPGFIAPHVLAAIGAAIGTTQYIQLKTSWKEPPVIWALTLGRSGSLKSPAHRIATAPIRHWEREQAGAYKEAHGTYKLLRACYETKLKAWQKNGAEGECPIEPEKPNLRRLLCADATVEALAVILENNPRGVLCARDELQGLLCGFNAYKGGRGGDVAQWLEMQQAGALIVDRKTGTKLTITIPRAAVSISGTIQPGVLKRVFGREHFENGLAARFLMVMPPSKKKIWNQREISAKASAEYTDIVEQLLSVQHVRGENDVLEPSYIHLTPAALKAWGEFFNEHAERQEAADDEHLAAAFSKLEAYAARFALIINRIRWVASSEDTPCRIEREDIEAGAEMARWFANETERIYALLTENELDRQRRELVEYIKRRGGTISVNELSHGPRKYRGPVSAARELLQDLVKAGLGQWDHATHASGGRPSERFVLAE